MAHFLDPLFTVTDTLVENMTVKEMILYTAQMKLPHTMAESEKVKATMEIMERLGLTRAQDTLIGGQSIKGISGGQVMTIARPEMAMLQYLPLPSATSAHPRWGNIPPLLEVTMPMTRSGLGSRIRADSTACSGS